MPRTRHLRAVPPLAAEVRCGATLEVALVGDTAVLYGESFGALEGGEHVDARCPGRVPATSLPWDCPFCGTRNQEDP